MRDIYTSPEAALDIIMERRKNQKLRAKVMKYLGGRVPDACFLGGDKPPAVLARYVPRATDEDRIFADSAKEAGFKPYWASYLGDRYTARNAEKSATARPSLRLPNRQHTRQWVVAEEDRSGAVGSLRTVFGGTVTDYQQGLRQLVFEKKGYRGIIDNTFDMTDWYKLQALRFGWCEGKNLAPHYYPAMMGLISVLGVMYEDWDDGPSAGNGDLARFREKVFYPAIDTAQAALGGAPIIVRLPYQKDMGDTGLEFLDKDEVRILREQGSKAVVSAKIGTI